MNYLIKHLAEAIDKKGMAVKFGLEAQGHIPTIEAELKRWSEDAGTDMAYNIHVWEAIGKKIGWHPFSAALAYFEFLNKQKKNIP